MSRRWSLRGKEIAEVPTSQKQKPSLKHVNLVKNLKKFLAFQWGRESFLWAIRTMKPGPKVMGKCEDPTGDFCKKLRQKTIRIMGFPLALQLVAFELIPQLLKQARGDDSTTLLTFPGQVLPQHAGLNVMDLRKAEHDAGPMMEISGTHDGRWAAWDDETYDKKGGGDGGDSIYKYREKVNAKKRKGAAHVGVTEAPVLKQRRVSGYFRRGAMVGAEQYRRMEAHVQELVLEVQQLKNVVEKQGRKFEKWKTFVKGKSSIKKQGSIKSRTNRRTVEGRKGSERSQDDEAEDDDDSVEDGVPAFSTGGTQGEGDVRTLEPSSRLISEDRPALLVRLPPGDGVPLQWVEPGSADKVVYRVVHNQTFFVHSEEEGSSVGGGSRDQGGSGDGLDASCWLLPEIWLVAGNQRYERFCIGLVADIAPLRGGDETGVGTEAEKKEENPDGAEGMGEQPSVAEVGRKQEGQSGGTDGLCGDVFENEREDFFENLGTVAGLGEANKVVIETEENAEKPQGAWEKAEQLSVDEAGRSEETKSGWTDGLGGQGVVLLGEPNNVVIEKEDKAEEMGEELRVENENDESDSQVGDLEDAEITGVGPKAAVLDVSDTSDGGRTTRHEPVEQEGELAAVLLGKNVGAVVLLGEPNNVVIEKEGKAEEMGEELRVENENDESDSQVGDLEDAEITGVGPKAAVLDVSDTSDGGRTTRHEPVEQEGELAAVLLGKVQYITPAIVPMAEDCDYAYFERVLLANLKVMHTNAGGYDLDNEFFIDTLCIFSWALCLVHMDVLADYVGRLHAEYLRVNRAMLVAPWFSAHLQVKERSFKTARRKTRIATDVKLTKFLTREGKKWGVDMDTLFDDGPVAAILPYLAKKVCPPHAVGEHQLAPFHVERVVGLYENRRSGDYGLLAIKFLEMHATGKDSPTMAGLTDGLVDIFRKQYALEIYKDWVVPLYL
ncbi:hypothetical protein F2Q69_00011085 [Brassica cretica]|uniref:Ubiquitin-like protease family profile domain-containing protein n=1 Tax=Brassica cretica TaxID=69181 RepID=A0A8S9QVK7_BRACR|nr:hypothetical protein F2Q69_00011085 [Brassica cretica]